MTTYHISIESVILPLISLLVGMTIRKIYYRNWKKIKVGYALVSGPKYRFDNADEQEIKEQIKKDDPKSSYILSVSRTKVRTHRDRDFADWDERVYEVTYI